MDMPLCNMKITLLFSFFVDIEFFFVYAYGQDILFRIQFLALIIDYNMILAPFLQKLWIDFNQNDFNQLIIYYNLSFWNQN